MCGESSLGKTQWMSIKLGTMDSNIGECSVSIQEGFLSMFQTKLWLHALWFSNKICQSHFKAYECDLLLNL